ncbi:MAG: 1-deoxy-D-xylulose-5-phosphate reductoisomerase [Spirochaetes bacterium]|nr:1-deoxy-D-xylulose-5-phosphate reductoisomerase [Spirochaetota bacterium]
MSSKISILGSTGSIGVSALKVLRSVEHNFEVFGLSCNNNLKLFREQLAEFNPSVAAVASAEAVKSEDYARLKKQFPAVTFFEGDDGVLELANLETDVLISAIVGAAGLVPTLASLANIKRLALANKETLVMAGDIVTRKVKEHGVELIPVDSEHSAIFSMIGNMDISGISRVILTASGGSMRCKTVEEMNKITPEQALIHPTWNMGEKITIDSATLINKGLEVIEAHHLFNLDYGLISVIIHPESIIHSMVETVDGAVYAYMSVPDMVYPIFNALFYPEIKQNPFGKLDFSKIGKLEFFKYDNDKFPALDLCYSAGKSGGTMPAVLNAANEVAVKAFLEKKILFTDIVKIVEKTMNKHSIIYNPDISAIFDSDKWSRERAESMLPGN